MQKATKPFLKHPVGLKLLKLESNENIHVLLGVGLLFLCTQISIPLEPIPITLQTFGVMLLGLTFERRAAIKSMITYLSLGAIGLPVFAELSGGYGVFLRPTGGYLIGFLMAVIAMTSIRKHMKKEGLLPIMLLSLLGSVIIFIFGILGLLRFMNVNQAIAVGFIPFIIPGLIKIALLTAVVKYLKFNFLHDHADDKDSD